MRSIATPVQGNGNRADARSRVEGDRELLEALRLREPTAADRLVAAYGGRAHRLAARITGNREDAEEAVQDALWAVVRKIDSFRGDAGFGSWLYRIVANAAQQKRRGGRNRSAIALHERQPFVDEHGRARADRTTRADDPALLTELRVALAAAITALPSGYRAALMLRDVEGSSILEIGGVLQLSGSSVKSRVHRARLCLRTRLSEYFVGAARGRRPEPAASPRVGRPERCSGARCDGG